MKKLVAATLVGVIMLWAGTAFAQSYSALGDMPEYGPWLGVGGVFVSGDNGSGSSESEVLPTINLAGVTDYLAWQAFYGFGSDSTAIGGSIDYIFANNFDECFTCPQGGTWWFGAGASIMDVDDLYFDANDATAALSDTFIGANLGLGYIWDRFAFDLFVHYFWEEEQLAVQGMFLYDVTN